MEHKKVFVFFAAIVLIIVLATFPFLTACSNQSTSTTAQSGTETTTTSTTSGSSGSSTSSSSGTTTLSSQESVSSEPKILKIGSPVALSGFFSAQDGVQAVEIKLAAQMINDDGGLMIDGQQYFIEIVEEDIKSNFDGVSAAMTKLIFDEDVKFIAGPGAFFNPPASPLANQNQVLHCMAFCLNQPGEMDTTTPYSFLGYNSWVGRTIAAVKCMKVYYPEVENVACVLVDDGGIPYMTPVLKNFLEREGLYLVEDGIVGFPNEMQDFSPVAAKLNALEDVDAVIHVTGIITHVGNIIKGYRELGNDNPYISCLIANCKDIKTVVGEDAASDIIGCAPTANAEGNPERLDRLIGMVQQELGADTAVYFENTGAFFSLIDVINQAQSVDPVVVRDYWENKVTEVDTLFGTGIMGGLQSYGVRHAVGHPHSTEVLMDGEVSFGGWYDVEIP